MFVFGPSLLLMGPWPTIVMTAITATIGVTCLAAALHNYFFFGHTYIWERAMLLVAALVLINPGLYTDLVGAALLGATITSQLMITRPIREPKRRKGDPPIEEAKVATVQERAPGE